MAVNITAIAACVFSVLSTQDAKVPTIYVAPTAEKFQSYIKHRGVDGAYAKSLAVHLGARDPRYDIIVFNTSKNFNAKIVAHELGHVAQAHRARRGGWWDLYYHGLGTRKAVRDSYEREAWFASAMCAKAGD